MLVCKRRPTWTLNAASEAVPDATLERSEALDAQAQHCQGAKPALHATAMDGASVATVTDVGGGFVAPFLRVPLRRVTNVTKCCPPTKATR